MLTPAMLEALIEVHNWELENSVIYEALATRMEVLSWPGSYACFHKQKQDEREHAKRVKDYIISQNASPVYAALPAPVIPDGADLTPYYQAALEREQATTSKWLEVYYTADQEEDPATKHFTKWFIDNQVQEERELVDKLTMLARATGPASLLLLDREFGK